MNEDKKRKKKINATRPLTVEEYKTIMNLLENGFKYKVPEYEEQITIIRGQEKVKRKLIGYKEKTFRKNPQVALALEIEGNVGLRIGDVLKLTLHSVKGGKLEVREQKTGDLQYRSINPILYNKIIEYALERGIQKKEKLFTITRKAVHKQLKIVTDYLDLTNIATHSFRKMYATLQYEKSKDAKLVQMLLNHSSLEITENYINLNKQKMDKASEEFYLERN